MTTWEGYTSKVERIGDIVRKTFRSQYSWMVGREKEALLRLEKLQHFPKYVSAGSSFIDMTYCGERQKITDKVQCLEILLALKQANIIHRDIIPRNLLTKEGVVNLIDFGWCLFDDEEESQVPAPPQLGGPYYNRIWNDENAMRICLREHGLVL
jgi:serine/threonine protein kinase